MLKNREEYQAMFETEEQLWWYKVLHRKVLDVLTGNGLPKDINILDAGCGTGGMLDSLKKSSYLNVRGFDYSEDAVEFSRSRGFDVSRHDILEAGSFQPDVFFDVILCNDVLYQFDDDEIQRILEGLYSRLSPHGLLISNNQAFRIFAGTHDIAVGSKQRFILKDLERLSSAGFHVSYSTYWSLFLSPLILFVRLLQRIRLKTGLIRPENVKSDVSLPSAFVNNLLYKIATAEGKLLKKSPFGSSLFVVFRKKG